MTDSIFLLEPNSIPIPPRLALLLKKHLKTRASDGASFLQQLHYWIVKGEGILHDEKNWIWNTYQLWLEQFSWLTEWDFRVITKVLRELDLIKFKQLRDCGRDRTGCYTLNYEHEWLKDLTNTVSCALSDATGKQSSDAADSCTPDITETTPSTSPENTTVLVEEENVEEMKRAIANAPFMQESISTDSPPQQELSGDDKFSAPGRQGLRNGQALSDYAIDTNLIGGDTKPDHFFSPNSKPTSEIKCAKGFAPLTSDITEDSSTPPPKKLIFPCSKQLKLHRVDLHDEDLQRVAKKFSSHLNDAIDAWLEWVKTLSHVNRPTRSLIAAIKDGWKPEKPTSREEIKPPPPGVLDRLKTAFGSVLEIPWQGGWCWGVGIGRQSLLPWWDALALGGEL